MPTPVHVLFRGGPLDSTEMVLADAPSVYEAPICQRVGNPAYGAYVVNTLVYRREPGAGVPRVYWFVREEYREGA